MLTIGTLIQMLVVGFLAAIPPVLFWAKGSKRLRNIKIMEFFMAIFFVIASTIFNPPLLYFYLIGKTVTYIVLVFAEDWVQREVNKLLYPNNS